MRYAQGGTQLWCPECGKVTVCKAVSPSSLGFESGQRFYKTDHTDIQWFRRGRECLTCKEEFLTAELPEDFVDELVKLRDALSEIKENAESYSKESKAAATSLEKLTNSLKVLKALRIYQKA
jgi:hypothetical protein